MTPPPGVDEEELPPEFFEAILQAYETNGLVAPEWLPGIRDRAEEIWGPAREEAMLRGDVEQSPIHVPDPAPPAVPEHDFDMYPAQGYGSNVSNPGFGMVQFPNPTAGSPPPPVPEHDFAMYPAPVHGAIGLGISFPGFGQTFPIQQVPRPLPAIPQPQPVQRPLPAIPESHPFQEDLPAPPQPQQVRRPLPPVPAQPQRMSLRDYGRTNLHIHSRFTRQALQAQAGIAPRVQPGSSAQNMSRYPLSRLAFVQPAVARPSGFSVRDLPRDDGFTNQRL